MKKVLWIYLVVLVLIVAIVGCSKTSNQKKAETTTKVEASEKPATTPADRAANEFIPGNVKQVGVEPPPTSKKTIKIGLCPPLSGLYHVTFYEGLKEGLATLSSDYEVELLYQLPNSETLNAATDQINTIETWLNQDIDAIVMCPPANDAMFEPVFKKAADRGVPVVEYGFDLAMSKNDYVVANVGYSQVLSAKAVGSWVAENYADKELKIAIISGTASEYTDLRLEGFMEGLKPHSNFKVVADQSGDWSREMSVNVMENILSAHSDVNLVFCMYDEMALGAVSAITNAGLLDKIDVAGYDTNIESYQAIKDGLLKCSVYNGTKQAGRFSVEIIKRYVMDGEMVDKAYFYTPVIIDQSTVDQFDPAQLKVD